MISKPKPYITVVTLPKDKIRLDVIMGAEPVEQMERAYLRIGKPDFMLNGGFFDMSNGKTSSNLIDDGVVKGQTCSNFGLIVDSEIRFGDITEAKADFIGGTPALLKNGKIDIDQSYGDSFNLSRHPRSAVGDNADNIFLVTVDGRRKKDAPGMTLLELAEFMLSLGCVNAINLDGGGSTRLLHNGDAINSPTENRKVDNFICVWMKEETKTMSKKKVFIDVGHGGTDPGAQANGLIEKSINLTVGLKLKELLLAKGFDVKLSRESDLFFGLTERCDMANAWKADCFIAVHHNAGGGDGWETIHTIHTAKSEGDEIAEAIGKEFTKSGQNMRRMFSRESTKYSGTDYYTVINKTNMASVITEFAFLDTEDYKAVDTVEELYKEAQAIANGLCNYYGVGITAPVESDWKIAGIEALAKAGVITDRDFWVASKDTKIDVWAACTMMANMLKLIEK